MQIFKRPRPLDEIAAQCVEQGVPAFLRGGLLHVGHPAAGHVAYSPITGAFSGETPEGMPFRSDSPDYEGHGWYDALLNFFYTK